MRGVPNIHEIERVLLLRQALDILEAPESEQRALYPAPLDAAEEMKRLFQETWQAVRDIFLPILPKATVAGFDVIDRALDAAPPDWDAIRTRATETRATMPILAERNAPRAFRDQVVQSHHHLLYRWQLESSERETVDAARALRRSSDPADPDDAPDIPRKES